jgi:H/ACA ribonucleoprotein complex subunit 2
MGKDKESKKKSTSNKMEVDDADDGKDGKQQGESVTPKKDSTKKVAETTTTTTTKEVSYEDRIKAVNVIAQPLAGKKSTKKIYKLVRKASSVKLIRRGVKEVVKGLRKGETGLCILAGDIYPLDVISFLPILLEEKSVPYLFVPSKQDLGASACTKRPTSVVLIKTKKGFEAQDILDALTQEAKEYNPLDAAVVTKR